MLDYRPAKFFRHQIIRRKFVRRQEPELAPIIAPLPESLQQRCIAAPGLVAQVIVSKFCDHLPLYRQEQIYWNRHQVWLPRQSLVRWVHLASEWLKPIYREIKDQMMSGPYIQVDETPIKYLDPGNGKTGQGYFWVAHRPGEDVLFEWHTTREAKCLQNSQSRPVCTRIHRVLQCWFITRRFLPQSTMGKAIHYALEQWESLEVYLQDPLIEIDNNLVENAIRPTALGKKNWLFFGDANAGERSAVIYSIIESCRRHGVEPYSYLRDVLTRLPSMTNRQIKDITPKSWAAARKATSARKAT